MFDAKLRPLIDPPLNWAGAALSRRGVGAGAVTLAGLVLGLVACAVVAAGWPTLWALLPLLLGRVADGLDGAVARAGGGGTDFGGYFDIFCDFVIYAAFPLAFALRDPSNALPAAALIASFYINAASFLGFAIMAEKRGLSTQAQGKKSLFYAAGLLEGAETIAFFAVLCLWPSGFAVAAWMFAGLCLLTAVTRMIWAKGVLV